MKLFLRIFSVAANLCVALPSMKRNIQTSDGFLKSIGNKLLGRSVVNNATNPNWIVNKRKAREKTDAEYRKFMSETKRRGYVR